MQGMKVIILKNTKIIKKKQSESCTFGLLVVAVIALFKDKH